MQDQSQSSSQSTIWPQIVFSASKHENSPLLPTQNPASQKPPLHPQANQSQNFFALLAQEKSRIQSHGAATTEANTSRPNPDLTSKPPQSKAPTKVSNSSPKPKPSTQNPSKHSDSYTWLSQGRKPSMPPDRLLPYKPPVPPSQQPPKILARPPVCRYGVDVAFPLAWLGLSCLLCYSKILPFMILLLLIPASLILGYYLVVYKFGQLRAIHFPSSRIAVTFAAALEVTGLLLFLTETVPVLNDKWNETGAYMAAILSALILHLAVVTEDPGVIWEQGGQASARSPSSPPSQGPDLPKTGASTAQKIKGAGQEAAGTGANRQGQYGSTVCEEGKSFEADIVSHMLGSAQGSMKKARTSDVDNPYSIFIQPAQGSQPGWCMTCKILRPARSKHCGILNRCINRYDHYCPFIHNAVGVGNQRLFVAYLFAVTVAQLLFLHLQLQFFLSQEYEVGAGSMIRTQAHQKSLMQMLDFTMLNSASQALVAFPGVMLFTTAVVPLAICCSYLLVRTLLCIGANLTTNEAYNRWRYPYLLSENGSYCNRFDRGPFLNTWQFWFRKEQNWQLLYDRANQEMVVKGQNAVVPLLSFGSVIRISDYLYKTCIFRRSSQ